MKKSNTVIILVIITVAFIISLFFFWKRNQKTATIYTTKTASVENIVLSTIATGSIIPNEEIEIRPNISGIIDKIYVKAGDEVKLGDKIASIKIIPTVTRLQSSKNSVSRAKIDLDSQRKIFERQKTLFEKGVISSNDFDRATITYKQSEQSYVNARENYDIVKTGTTKGFGGLANTTIRATISGLVLDVPVEEGAQVTETNNFRSGTLIASVADISKMIFKGRIDESEVGKIREGLPIKITIGAIQNKTFKATLNYIAPKGFLKGGTVQFDIEAALELDEGTKIRSGLSANASIILNKVDNVLALNESLIQYNKKTKKSFVEVEVGEQEYEKRSIELGISDGINVEIKGGITESDQIKVWNPISSPANKSKGGKNKKGKRN